MTPLHSHHEYISAKRVYSDLRDKINNRNIKLSDIDVWEFYQLGTRILMYETNPTPPNIIKAAGGNVDNNLKQTI